MPWPWAEADLQLAGRSHLPDCSCRSSRTVDYCPPEPRCRRAGCNRAKHSMKQEELEEYLSRPKKRSRKAEAKHDDNAVQMRCWKQWRRQQLAALFSGPYGPAVRQLVRLSSTWKPNHRPN